MFKNIMMPMVTVIFIYGVVLAISTLLINPSSTIEVDTTHFAFAYATDIGKGEEYTCCYDTTWNRQLWVKDSFCPTSSKYVNTCSILTPVFLSTPEVSLRTHCIGEGHPNIRLYN